MDQLELAWVALMLAFTLMMSQRDGRSPSFLERKKREFGDWAYVIVLFNSSIIASVIVLFVYMTGAVLEATMRP